MATGYVLDGPTTAPMPVLHAENEAAPWNGFSVPIVTVREFAYWLGQMDAWIRRGGEDWPPFGPLSVRDDRLILGHDADHDDDDEWRRVGTRKATGEALFALDGWTWFPADDTEV